MFTLNDIINNLMSNHVVFSCYSAAFTLMSMQIGHN